MRKKSLFRKSLVAIPILFFLLMLLSGLISCGKNPNQISVPSPSSTPYESHYLSYVVRRLDGLNVDFGGSASEIIEAYGSPSHDEILPNYDPPVVRSIIYDNLGLTFSLDQDHLCGVHVEAPSANSINGVRIGDSIDQVISVLGTQMTYEERGIDGVWYQGYIWRFAEFWREEPDEMPGGEHNYDIEMRVYTDRDEKIVFFEIEHPRYCGNWIGIP